jgi:RNase P/RNase MRP subunit POP5
MLIPTLREKKRYLVFKIIGGRFDKRDVEKAIKQAFLDFLGELGLSRAGLLFPLWKKNKNVGVIRVNNKFVEEAKFCLSLIKQIGGERVLIRDLRVCGALKKTKDFYL